MRLQTMLLPTGEFILVMSEVPQSFTNPNSSGAASLRHLKESMGAAGIYLTTDAVEVTDSLVDSDAKRCDAKAPWGQVARTLFADLPTTHPMNTAGDHFYEVGEASVKVVDGGTPRPSATNEVIDIDYCPCWAGLAKTDLADRVQCATCPRHKVADGDVASVPARKDAPREFKAGDRVRISGKSFYGYDSGPDQVGEFIEMVGQVEPLAVVQLAGTSHYYKPEQLTLLEED